MRDIEYRGKSGDKWCFGFFEKDANGVAMITPHAFATVRNLVDPETVGQYTGLKDKNGVKVFEGDIVHYKDIDTTVYIGTVSFHTRYAEFCCLGQRFGHVFPFDYESMERYEVKGNVHDNPEMLREK
jgi:uncharacterized phage protein (TIGR01671 family)